MKIITLTLNPAFDIHCDAENFVSEKENIATVTSKNAGGKGVNISRALAEVGVESTAVIVLGKENADEFLNKLPQDKFNIRKITVDGKVRENIIVHTKGRPETRLSFTGLSSDDSIIQQIEDEVLKTATKNDIVTLTGRIPDCVSLDAVKNMIYNFTKSGIKTVIDSNSFSLNDIIDCKPFLIKPNEEEISEYFGKKITDFSQILSGAKQLHSNGIENVIVSLGKKGAMLVCNSGCFVATPPEIKALSTIGAGDSLIAGFLMSKTANSDCKECLINAVAFGTATCLTEGTNPPSVKDIERLKKEVQIKKYDLL